MSRAQKVNSRVVQTNPMRYPDERDERQMGRRGWWLVVIGFLIPGSAQVLAGNKRLGRFGLGATIVTWVFVAVMLGLFLFAKESFLSVLDQTWILYVARALLIAYAVLWLILAIDTLRLVRFVRTRTKARVGIAVLSAALMVVSTGTALYAANLVGVTGETIDNIFTDEAVLPEDNGRYNILLLGADSGEGRDSMRFDSISVASVDMKTGQVTVIGIPRDMPHVPFNPDSPMYQLYPNGHEGHYDPECGWDSKINQLNTELDLCRDGAAIYPNAKKNNSTPGIEATRDAAEGVTGLEIQYYVFLDMDHFAQLIDAVGGVNINVLERIPEGGGPAYEGQSADEWATGWIEAGQQHMDGRTAQWYARSRYTTSDWDRMRRQGELQSALLAQIDAQTLLTRFQELAKAGTELVDTDLPKSLLSRFVNVAGKARALEMKRIELVPPLVDADNPDFAAIRQMLHDEFNPASPSDTPTSESEGEQG